MSSQDQAPSETTALLVDSRLAGQSSKSLLVTRGGFTFSPETRLIPVAIATTLAAGIPSTTLIELVRQAVCRLWYISRSEPASLRTGSSISLELCDVPEIARYFSIVLAVLGAIRGTTSIVGFGMSSRISSRYGRKPAFLLVLIAGTMSSSIIAGSQHAPDWLTGWIFLLGMFCGVFSAPLHYLINMYMVDLCGPEDRTAALSKISGWAGLGTCISFALGGSITTITGNAVTVFYMATAIYVATFIYVVSFLPESFPEEKRNALSRMFAEPSMDGPSGTTRFASLRIFEPLKLLIPTRKSDGIRNWRLTWCAAHAFLLMVAESYTWSAWLVLATSKHHLTPADTGLFFTMIAVSSTIFLTVIVPPLIRCLRPYYHRQTIHPIHAEEGMIHCEELVSETSDRLHVHLAVAACVIASVTFFGAAAFMTRRALIFFGIIIGIATVHGPTIRSLVAGSVDPLKQGEALAAISMVSHAGSSLSPIIMGSIFSATIETTPLFLFYVHMVVALISCSLLFLVRDADRYQKPHDA